MVESPAISTLESAAADLGKLLNGWTRDLLAESEAAPADLAAINAGIQSLWRLVSIQKSIQQLKNPPTAPSPDRPSSEFRFGVQTSVCPNPDPIPQTQPAPSARHAVARASARDDQPNPSSPPANSANRQSSVPWVPFVPSVPSLPAPLSIEAIAAKTEKLFAQTAALIEKANHPVPGPTGLPNGNTSSPLRRVAFPGLPVPSDPVKSILLDAVTRRPTFPGSGGLLDSLRAELMTSPP